MNNWLAMPELWKDEGTSTTPPVSWNPTTERYEIDLPYGEELVYFGIQMFEAGPNEDGIINFDLIVNDLNVDSPDGMAINILKWDEFVGSTVVLSQSLYGFSQVNIQTPAQAGAQYRIYLVNNNESPTTPIGCYAVNMMLEPIAYEEEVPPVASGTFPWWYCIPATPAPAPPARPEGFVLFADYDADYRYPLASSRVPMSTKKAPIEEGCHGCAPEIIVCMGCTVVNVEAPEIPPNSGEDGYLCGNTLTTTNGVWESPCELTYTYQWYHDGSPVVGGTSNSYYPDHGGDVFVEVTATPPGDAGYTSTSNSVYLGCG